MRTATVIAACVAALGLTACADQSDVVVFAAASLSTVGDDLESAFELEYPDTDITFSYAGSSELVRQISAGAPADLLITADTDSMAHAALSGVPVAAGHLVLAVAPGNPAGIESARQLGNARLALCATEVPCGRLTHQFLTGAVPESASVETNETDVAAKVSNGSVDAGFIYESTARQHGLDYFSVDGVESNLYPAALTSRGADNSAAEAFVDWLSQPEAQAIFADHGFNEVDQ